MDDAECYIIEGINPTPWTAPSGGTGRRGGKVVAQFYKSAELDSYQRAVREAMLDQYPRLPIAFKSQPVGVTFYFWRQLSANEVAEFIKSRKHRADATNLQKSLEDALQGVLYPNDNLVSHPESWLMEQSAEVEPCILIVVERNPQPPPYVTDLLHLARSRIERKQVVEQVRPDFRVEDWF